MSRNQFFKDFETAGQQLLVMLVHYPYPAAAGSHGDMLMVNYEDRSGLLLLIQHEDYGGARSPISALLQTTQGTEAAARHLLNHFDQADAREAVSLLLARAVDLDTPADHAERLKALSLSLSSRATAY